MRIGIVHNTIVPAGLEGLEESFRLAAEAGAEGVEVVYSDPEEARALGVPAFADELAALADRHGLTVPSLNLAILCASPSLLGTPEDVVAAVALIQRAIASAGQIGAAAVVLPFFAYNAIETEEQLSAAADALGELVEPAEEAGVTLAVESSLNFNQMRFLLDTFASPDGVKICVDTANAVAHRLDVATGIRELGAGAIAEVHFKDVQLEDGQPPRFDLALGEGEVDFRGVVQALKAIGYDGWVLSEAPAAEAAANLAFARQMLGGD